MLDCHLVLMLACASLPACLLAGIWAGDLEDRAAVLAEYTIELADASRDVDDLIAQLMQVPSRSQQLLGTLLVGMSCVHPPPCLSMGLSLDLLQLSTALLLPLLCNVLSSRWPSLLSPLSHPRAPCAFAPIAKLATLTPRSDHTHTAQPVQTAA